MSMEQAQWFQQLLQTSMDNFLWAVEQIPHERLHIAPRPNRWPVARLVYHLTRYEQRLALPSMQQWLGGSQPVVGTQESRYTNIAPRLQGDMFSTIALFPQFTEQRWNEKQSAIWGDVSLKWVITKTYQHRLEHTDEVLRAYLWMR